MDLKIKGKIALVTGAGRGLGYGICKSLVNEGAIIIGCSRTEKDLIDLSKVLNNNLYASLQLYNFISPKPLLSGIILSPAFIFLVILGFNPKVLHNNFTL
jgi:hypothetical protein